MLSSDMVYGIVIGTLYGLACVWCFHFVYRVARRGDQLWGGGAIGVLTRIAIASATSGVLLVSVVCFEGVAHTWSQFLIAWGVGFSIGAMACRARLAKG